MKVAAKAGRAEPIQIYADAIEGTPAAVRQYLPNEAACKRTMLYARGRDTPALPKTLDELVIEGQWATTAGVSPENFLLFDNGPEAGERIIIFATQQGLEYLAHAERWFMDGMFSTSPRLFQQLYTIRVPLGESAITVVYALLQNKTQATYTTFLDTVVQEAEARCGITPNPTRVNIDFEKAMINAIDVALEESSVQLCFYHLTQSPWRKTQKLGLTDE